MLLLLSLITRRTRMIELLVDYNRSHVITSNECLEILQ